MENEHRNSWDLLALAIWALFFAVGLVPELVFQTLRDLAGVITRTAFVNTSGVITVSFTAYIALFTARRCRDSGMSDRDARDRALQIAILGIAAFLEIPARAAGVEARSLLEIMVSYRELPDAYLQGLILIIGASKIVSWCYLFSLVLRYHAFANRNVFMSIPPLFPSLRRRRTQDHTETEVSSAAINVVDVPPIIETAPIPSIGAVSAEKLTDDTRRN
ncbi:MAG: hypothetical protein IID08_03825 [Candidatus Hydrogenedentes bacterium]|nr:hypothetical protein [Candidatus Hydrogenedentota bacterium]